jgi:ABC-type transport system substrate-binding protein
VYRFPAIRSAARTIAKPGGTLSLTTLSKIVHGSIILSIITLGLIMVCLPVASAATRPHYGGTLRVMMQSAPDSLDLPANATPSQYWGLARTLYLIGDTLVTLDAQSRPQPSLATAWRSDSSARHWEFTLRPGIKFQDGSVASPAAVAQILAALHPSWSVRASSDQDSISIDSEIANAFLLAELALPRNLLLKRALGGVPIGTGSFLVTEWHSGKTLKLAANEESWAGRPFVDAVQIEFGKSLRDQAVALELDKADVIEIAPQAVNGSQPRASSSLSSSSSSLSLPVELFALVFPANSRAQDPRVRQALALGIDRKPIQAVLLKGAGEPAASILPNWMTGYTAVFSTQVNGSTQVDVQRAHAILAESRQPALNLSYDPGDPQAQLIAERIALDARQVGLTVLVSLSGATDIRLIRVVLPSPDPATSLAEGARQLGLTPSTFSTPHDASLENLYHAERSLLDESAVIPLFHLPVACAVSGRVRNWQPDRLGDWAGAAGLWLSDARLSDSRAGVSLQ